MTNVSLLGFWLRFSSSVNCESLKVAILPETEEGSGEFRKGSVSANPGTDHADMVKHRRKKVAMERAVRKRMMKYTSKIMGFDWVEGHEECQRP